MDGSFFILLKFKTLIILHIFIYSKLELMDTYETTSVMRFIPRTDFSQNLLKELNKQRKSAECFCDVLLKTDDVNLYAHRAVLGAQSRYFRIMFSSSFRESSCFTVDLTHAVSSDVLELVLEYMYSGQIEIHKDICVDLLKVADFLLLDSLKTECAQYLATNLGPQNCIFVWECAICFHLPQIAKLCKSVIEARFHDFIANSNEILLMKPDNLKYLVDSGYTKYMSERQFYNFLQRMSVEDPRKKSLVSDLMTQRCSSIDCCRHDNDVELSVVLKCISVEDSTTHMFIYLPSTGEWSKIPTANDMELEDKICGSVEQNMLAMESRGFGDIQLRAMDVVGGTAEYFSVGNIIRTGIRDILCVNDTIFLVNLTTQTQCVKLDVYQLDPITSQWKLCATRSDPMCPGFGRALITTHNGHEMYMLVTQPSGRVVRATYDPYEGYLFYRYKLGQGEIDKLPNVTVNEEEHTRYFSLLGYSKEMIFQGQKNRILFGFAEKIANQFKLTYQDFAILKGTWSDKQSLKMTPGGTQCNINNDKLKNHKVISKTHALTGNFVYFVSFADEVCPYPCFTRCSLSSELKDATNLPPPPIDGLRFKNITLESATLSANIVGQLQPAHYKNCNRTGPFVDLKMTESRSDLQW
jgi:hypothetical protein